MRDRKVATRYARALLGALPDPAEQRQADAFLSELAESVRANPELRAFLLDPAVAASSKREILERLGSARGLPKAVTTFVAMLVDNRRVSALSSIAEVFHAEREAGQGEVSATLTTAAPVAPELQARVAHALERLSGRKVNLKVETDAALLGGAVAQVGSLVYDGSLKTQLTRLRRTMGEE